VSHHLVFQKSACRNSHVITVTLLEAINNAEAKLTTAGIAAARLDAEVLLSYVLKKDRAWIITHIHDVLDGAACSSFQGILERRTRREPLQYLTGKQEFWGLEFKVTPDVLIPRPETELVVETAIGIAAGSGSQAVIVDLGVGSGCITISLAKELPGARFFAIDKAEEALIMARENASKHGVSNRIRFLNGDLFEPLEKLDIRGRIDIIVSNPPYVGAGESSTLQPEVRDYEPGMALFAGPLGTEIHKTIIENAPEYLKRQGALVMEMGIGQAGVLCKLIRATGAYEPAIVHKDLAGIERVIVARKK
jgi:release factor glutamine methyltransferase